jgi:hypothetical protein
MRGATSSRMLNESQRLSDMRSGHRYIGVAEDTLLFLLKLVDDCSEAGGGGWVEDLLLVRKGDTYRTFQY